MCEKKIRNWMMTLEAIILLVSIRHCLWAFYIFFKQRQSLDSVSHIIRIWIVLKQKESFQKSIGYYARILLLDLWRTCIILSVLFRCFTVIFASNTDLEQKHLSFEIILQCFCSVFSFPTLINRFRLKLIFLFLNRVPFESRVWRLFRYETLEKNVS